MLRGMDEKQRTLLDCQSTWRDEAHKTAATEADHKRLQGHAREDFIKEREAERYAELEKLGMDNLR